MNDLQPCKHCRRICNREHFAQAPQHNGQLITYLYCDDCGMGWETVWTKSGLSWSRDFDIVYTAKSPLKLHRFLTNLEAANSVAA